MHINLVAVLLVCCGLAFIIQRSSNMMKPFCCPLLTNTIDSRMRENTFAGYIWSPLNNSQKKNVLQSILDMGFVVTKYDIYTFANTERDRDAFKNSIKDIYRTDDIDIQTIEKNKIPAFLKTDTSDHYQCLYFEIQLSSSDAQFSRKHSYGISDTIEKIKEDIRNKYKQFVANYMYDVVIHIADNYEQISQLKDIMKTYRSYKSRSFMNVKYLLTQQFVGTTKLFNRCDILVRKHVAENFLNDPDCDEIMRARIFEMYNKMQRCRGQHTEGVSPHHSFVKLLVSIKQHGLKDEFPIKITNKHFKLVDGSHRLSYAYLKNISFIAVEYTDEPQTPVVYNSPWFLNCFSVVEMSKLYSEIFILMYFLHPEDYKHSRFDYEHSLRNLSLMEIK